MISGFVYFINAIICKINQFPLIESHSTGSLHAFQFYNLALVYIRIGIIFPYCIFIVLRIYNQITIFSLRNALNPCNSRIHHVLRGEVKDCKLGFIIFIVVIRSKQQEQFSVVHGCSLDFSVKIIALNIQKIFRKLCIRFQLSLRKLKDLSAIRLQPIKRLTICKNDADRLFPDGRFRLILRALLIIAVQISIRQINNRRKFSILIRIHAICSEHIQRISYITERICDFIIMNLREVQCLIPLRKSHSCYQQHQQHQHRTQFFHDYRSFQFTVLSRITFRFPFSIS